MIWNRLTDTGHYPYGYEAPTGYPDDRAQWQGSGPLIMSWQAVTYMLRQSSIVNLAEQANVGLPLAEVRTPNNLVNFWMHRALGYELEHDQKIRIVDFVVQSLGGAADTAFSNTATGNIDPYQKINRAVLGLILMSPDAMRR